MAFTNTPPQLLTRALAEGRCLLLFDGLDEVANPEVRVRLARSLAELARLSPGNRVIIGSRPAGVSESEGALRPQFQRCQIERFTAEDVQRFFRFWYALDRGLTAEQKRDAADALYARVQAAPATLELANTPLLSTILVLIWRNEGHLPERRVDLYERCCRVLIEHWERHHDIAYRGIFAQLGWKRHLHLLAPLAHDIHKREERSAGRTDLIEPLTKSLQVEGLCTSEAQAKLEAEQFLETMGLRSGLLQDLGDDRYSFPHQTFQEYLTARYIAAQPDPDYIDLAMEHLHEAWWQEVHLLTIAHLGSGNVGACKASDLIMTILHVYRPPNRILRSSRNRWLRLIEPGKLLPQVQLERRIAWILAREFELVIKGYAECVLSGTTAKVGTMLSAQAASLVRHIVYDKGRSEQQKALLTVICQSLQRQGNEVVVSALLEALHDTDKSVRRQAVESLGQVEADNEVVVSALLEAVLHDADTDVWSNAVKSLEQIRVYNEAVVNVLLKALQHNTDPDVRWRAARSLRKVGVGNEVVVSALLEALHDTDKSVRQNVLSSLGKVGAGNEVVVSALLEALHDTERYVRRGVAWSLGQVGAGNEVVVSVLLEALHDTDLEVRRGAAWSLEEVGAGNEVVASAWLQALHDADSGVRQDAVWSLGEVGAGNAAVTSALLKALHDTDLYVRRNAAGSLGEVGAGNEAVVNALLEVLHDADSIVRGRAAGSLGEVGAGNQAVVSALLEVLHNVRWEAATSLGRLEIKNTTQLRQVLVVLNRCLYDWNGSVRGAALVSIRQLLDGRPIPGYRWMPLRKRRARRLRLKRIAFWLGMTAVMVIIGLAATWLLGILDPNGFPVRFLAVLAGIVAFVAAVAQFLGRTLRDPWEHS